MIGAGIIGCACAYYLARRGLSVAVLDRAGIAAGASGACDGHLAVQTKAPGLHSRLAAGSIDLYRQLPDCFQEQAELRTCGSLLVAERPAETSALEALISSRCTPGAPVELVTGTRARELEPALAGHIVAASHCPTDAQANPWGIARWFAEAAAQMGAQILSDCALQALAPDARSVRVRTARGDFAARYAVIAAGPWTPHVCADLVQLPITPRRGEVFVTERLPRLLNGLVLSASYLASKFSDSGGGEATPAIEQSIRGNVLIGGTREFVGLSDAVSSRGTRDLAAAAVRMVPPLQDAHVIRSFAGLRPHTPDGLPFVGPLPDWPRVVVAAGHEGDGVALAPLTGSLIADYICEGTQPAVELSVSRLMT